MGAFQTHVFLHDGIDKLLEEERCEQRGDHLAAFLYDAAG